MNSPVLPFKVENLTTGYTREARSQSANYLYRLMQGMRDRPDDHMRVTCSQGIEWTFEQIGRRDYQLIPLSA